MEKSQRMNKNVSISALFLALCIFIDSTAFGFQTIFNWGEIQKTSASKRNIGNEKIILSSYKTVEKNQNSNIISPDGGPDQPEVQSFTPIGTSDMVDPFTGDFSYNIPLLDVDGYPVNIAYSAGATMDQEASWVGLGWNLNPGVVNRSMRGVPDEFNGNDTIVKEMNLKKNWTVGGSLSLDYELFGFGATNENTQDSAVSISLNAALGINYNNYTGFSSSFSTGLGFSFSPTSGLGGSAGLGFSGSSQGGASISPKIGLTYSQGTGIKAVTNGINIGTSINSRDGLANTTVGYTRTSKKAVEAGKSIKNRAGKELSSVNRTLPINSSYNFAMSTFTPSISMPMSSGGGTFSFKLGTDIVGNDFSGEISGFYNAQWLKDKQVDAPAFGYMNLAAGQNNPKAMLDFNRENDGQFTKNTPVLPIPNLTYDIFSVSGQGVAGSYRPVRKDIGYVFDPSMNTNSVNGSLGLELNLGGTFKGGIDVALTYSNANSGAWDNGGNKAAKYMKFENDTYYFREANELSINGDPNHLNSIGGSNPLRFDVQSHRRIDNSLDDTHGNFYSSNNYSKSGIDRRNQVVYTLTNYDLLKGLGVDQDQPNSFFNLNSEPEKYYHHIGQFTVLNVEGSRYVYGLAAYSHDQYNVSFAVGATSDTAGLSGDCATGLVQYVPDVDNTKNNTHGVDNYFNSVKTPAFAHSYLLTSVLNADYIDADNIKGPSKGDLGGYLHFSYKKIDNYQWRSPVNLNRASFDEGLNTDNTDDKGHYIHGTKELWYVETIQSKNHIAVFYSSPRDDGRGVNNNNGGINQTNPSMLKLDSIALFSLPDYEQNGPNATSLKTVHFEYDYTLCQNYSQNIIGTSGNNGKLTLTKVYFTYQNSNKGKYTPYQFKYGQRFINGIAQEEINPSYNIKEVDRWNNYKKQLACTGQVQNDQLKPSDFPYVGFDKIESDKAATAWNLTTIILPSGGSIQVDYESDSYAYVQNKRANQMLRIIGVEKNGMPDNVDLDGTENISNNITNASIYFELIPGFENISDYTTGINKVYFRALMKFSPEDQNGNYDFVPGYAEIESTSIVTLSNGLKVGKLKLKGASLKDSDPAIYNPISVAAIQFARIHLSKFIPPSSTSSVDENANLPGLTESLRGAFSSFEELFDGPNIPLWKKHVGTDLVIGNSWVRLQNPNKNKLGGGHRVKEIRMYDSWKSMTKDEMSSQYYGQQYSYTEVDGTSSGVASYEPQIGGDENPWRQPVADSIINLLAPDERNYKETPFGEQFFPSPGVGYSKVTIQDLQRANVSRTATGKVVHEFYTAKDFPTIVKYTKIDLKRLKIPVFAVFFSSMIDEMAASQGFVVETNDMHGKQKRQSVFAQNQSESITFVEYTYQSEPLYIDGNPSNHLTNTVTSIQKNGTISQSTVGVSYEAVADFRQSNSNTISGSGNFNTNFTLPFFFVPVVSGSGSYERTAFRSATFTKVIERFGILTKTKAKDLGSEVETNNLAYDAETGTVLLTQTTTDFNDKVYSFTYPAHWYYDQMGQAYRNVGISETSLQFVNGGTGQVNSSKFSRGDEVAFLLSGTSNYDFGWVTESSPSGIRVLLKDGTPLNGNVIVMRVLRSGRKNLQTTPIGTIALRDNPLDNLAGNIFQDVLQAGSVEYSDDWRTFCECFLNEDSDNYTTNPYVLGTRGNWRPVASYVHLSGRAQTYENGNSNIRQDGMFTSFNPFYKLNGGTWNIDRQYWTYTSSVVEYSPFGQALETIDALNRYSSSMFGYNQTLPVAVAANTRYRQLGFDGFEDYNYLNCSDNHFKIGVNAEIVSNEAHTGRKSIKVNSGTSIIFSNTFIENCDENLCDIKPVIEIIRIDKTNNLKYSTLVAAGGTAPYQYDYQIIQGNASVELNENGDGLLIKDGISGSPNPTIIRLTITDANGCQSILEL
jgi:hypothetical protein